MLNRNIIYLSKHWLNALFMSCTVARISRYRNEKTIPPLRISVWWGRQTQKGLTMWLISPQDCENRKKKRFISHRLPGKLHRRSDISGRAWEGMKEDHLCKVKILESCEWAQGTELALCGKQRGRDAEGLVFTGGGPHPHSLSWVIAIMASTAWETGEL